MKKLVVLILSMILLSASISAKEESTESRSFKGQKAVYLEVFGTGILGSFNYEVFTKKNMAIRIGAIAVPNGSGSISSAFLMAMFVNAKPREKFFVDSGIGIGVFGGSMFGEESLVLPYLTVCLGVRYQPKPTGLLIRASINTIYYYPWAGISIGYVFK